MLRWWYLLVPVPTKLSRQYDRTEESHIIKINIVFVPLFTLLLPMIKWFVPHSVHVAKAEPEKTEDDEHVCDSSKCE